MAGSGGVRALLTTTVHGTAVALLAATMAACSPAPETAAPSAPAAPASAPDTFALPAPDLGSAPLADALAGRRSARAFTAAVPTEQQAATLLWAAQGVTSAEGGRTAPSAGARYPLEVYWLTDDEAWQYVPDGHRAQVRDPSALRSEVAAAVGQEAAVDAPALIVVTGTPERLRDRYGDRSERYTLLEAGHSAQNMLLAATALGLGAVPIGAVDDGAVGAALGLPAGESVMYVIPVGTPD
jgi:SagB-type dehydrogenase family enzyme